MLELTREEQAETIRALRCDLGLPAGEIASLEGVTVEEVEAVLGPELSSPRFARVVDPSYLEEVDRSEGRERSASPDAVEAVLRWLAECGGSQ